jgi:hypothetical protein
LDEVPGCHDQPVGHGGSCYVMAQTAPQKKPGDLSKRVVYSWGMNKKVGLERSQTMPKQSDRPTHDQRTGRFRFTIIGSLLSNPPARCELQGRLQQLLSQQAGAYPRSGQPTPYGVSTFERWHYQARQAPCTPSRKGRRDFSTHPSMNAEHSELQLDHYR